MSTDPYERLVTVDVGRPVWDHFFVVHNLVVVGTRQAGGEVNLAPKHMAIPMGWQNYFGFACTPRHRTYLNIKQEREFTVSYPRPSQVLETALTATPRCEDDSKPSLESLPTFQASEIDCPFLADSYAYLECRLHRIIDGFGENSLIVGSIIAAHVDPDAIRGEREDGDIIRTSPLLAYLSPRRFSHISKSHPFPFPDHFKK